MVFYKDFQIDIAQGQIIRCDFLQGFKLFGADVASFALLEAEHKKPTVILIGCQKCPCTSAFTPTGNGYTFFDNPAAQVCIDKTRFHFRHRIA